MSPDLSRFVQVDLMKPAGEVTLGADVVSELLQGVEVLHALTRYRRHEGLRQFREQFTQRYETREVPLALALDEENGIGFERSSSPAAEAAPLLAGLPLRRAQDQSAPWIRRDTFLLGKLTRALATGSDEITVGASEAAAVRASDIPPLPDAFEVLAAVVAGAEKATGHGDFQVVLHSASGPSGVRLLGRFCHADDQLHQLVRAHLAAEEAVHPERVFAEVVHLPEGRVGNILSRPVLRGYEIPYLGRSGAPADRQLPLSDLLVSVQGERIVLRSRRLGCEVIPRLTTAHNHTGRGLGVYRFLCALQYQQVTPGITWDWGPLGQAPFLPRVVSGRVILSRARWNLGESELAAFREPRGARQFAAVQRLRERHRMPRYVALADGDNELVADLDNVLSLETLAHEVRGRASASFVEMVPGPGQLCASGPEGPFTHQVIVPFVRSSPPPAAQSPGRPGRRRRAPGVSRPGRSGCTSSCSPARRPRIRCCGGPHAPSGHRSRLAGPTGGSSSAMGTPTGTCGSGSMVHRTGCCTRRCPCCTAPWHRCSRPASSGASSSTPTSGRSSATAERPGSSLAERIFHADSDAVLAIVRLLTGDAGAELRWRVALRGIDLLFDDLGLTLEQKRAIAGRARRGYGSEFGADGDFQREVSRRYRNERASVETLLDPQRDPPAELAASLRMLHQRSTVLAPAAQELRALADAGRLSVDIPELAMSLAHMHVNRILRSAQRAQELVLYELLGRAYSSQAARRSR